MSGSERFAARRSFWIFTSRILQPHVKTLPHSPLLILLSSNPKSLPNFLGVHEFRIIEMYLIMGRYSGRRLWSVMGNARSPSHLDQFNRRSDGRSVELRSAKDGWLPLSPHFDEVFGRYLRYLNIDPLHPLPSIPTFPKIGLYPRYSSSIARLLAQEQPHASRLHSPRPCCSYEQLEKPCARVRLPPCGQHQALSGALRWSLSCYLRRSG